jgi:hypothetical protein
VGGVPEDARHLVISLVSSSKRVARWNVLVWGCLVAALGGCGGGQATPGQTGTLTQLQPRTATAKPAPARATSLPGETFWPNRVSNLIFGTNDTGEWGTPNVEFTNAQTAPGTPNASVQGRLRRAGLQLDRAFVPHNDFATGREMTDAEIAARANTAASVGAQCMMVLVSVSSSTKPAPGQTMTDLQFAEHVVKLTDGTHPGIAKCSMFEIGNEPDCGGGPFSNGVYASTWARFVTALRTIRPSAKYIGPVSCLGINGMLDFLKEIVTNRYPVPDAISWHWYPCGHGWAECPLSLANQIVTDAQTVRGYLRQTIGHQLPIGISEWSADPTPSGTKNMAYTEPEMSNFITASLNAMVQAKLDFAAEFDAQSVAAYGGLDMFSSSNTPRPYFNAFANEIAKYK